MTPDGSIHVLIRELRTLANELSAEDEDMRAAHVWNAILDLKRAFSEGELKRLEDLDHKRLGRLRIGLDAA